MAALDEFLVNPLVLILIGAVISGITTPYFNYQSERNKKWREVRLDIISKMAEAIAQLDAEVTFLINRKKKLEKEEKNAFFQNAKKWYMDERSIHSKLEAYFPDTDIADRWYAYYDLLNNFVNASRMYFDQDDTVEYRDLQLALDNIKQHLSYEKSINLEKLGTTFDENQWLNIQSIIRRQGDELIKDILKLKLTTKVF